MGIAKLFTFCLAAMGMIVCVSCSKDHPTSQKSVVLYCSVDQQVAEPIVAEFEKRSGIKVKARYDTEASKTVGLVQKIRAEAKKPAADVFWSSEVFHTIRLGREGLLAPYESAIANDWPEKFKDPDNRWFGFALRGRVIGYHTERVTAEEAPKSLEAVLDQRWRGRVVMATPKFGTTGGDVASWFAHYGEVEAVAILKKLKANGVRLVDGNSTAVRMLVSGQADVCFTDTDDVYAAQRNGWPISMHPLDQNSAGSLTIPNTAALIKNGPHPETARILMEFLLSETTERMLVESDSHNSPIHPTLQNAYTQYAITQPLQIDYDKVSDQLNHAIQHSLEILR